MKGLIDLHALLLERFGGQNLGAHDGFKKQTQKAADAVGKVQNQQGQARTDGDHDQPDGSAGSILPPDGFREQLPHALFRQVDELADEDDGMGHPMGISHDQVKAKAQNQGVK